MAKTQDANVRNLFLIELAKQLITNKGMISNPLFQPAEIKEIKTLEMDADYLPSPKITESPDISPDVVNSVHEKIITIKEVGEPLRQKISQPVKEPPVIQVQYTTAWGKLNDLMNDPGVENIECSGPERPIIVTKEGKQMQTQISLKNDEIKKILHTISKEAHVPIESGILKAETSAYLATAVISEFVGSRLFVQKKHPIMR